MARKPDFSGWATKFNILCADGRTIRPEAFKECDGMTVPLVWGHEHDEPSKVLGHALLSYKPPEGVRMDGFFNKTENGMIAKEAVGNGDVTHLSIFANRLQHAEGTRDVIHGMIREVSLVLAGANPGAVIDNPTLAHSGELYEEEAHIYMDDSNLIIHSEQEEEPPAAEEKPAEEEDLSHADTEPAKGDKTVGDILDSMTDEQRKVTEYLVEQALKASGEAEHSEIQNGGNPEMKKNIFDAETPVEESGHLSHDEMAAILKDGKKYGTLKESFLAHAEESEEPEAYGIQDIEWLFPDFRNVNNVPEWIKRPDDWVSDVMNGVKHSPFARIKTMQADITADEARAKGYMKGNRKKEEVFTLLKRTTPPQTIYKKQKLDRDDIIDITSFDVVAWLKTEMRMMLNEEIARAILIGDGREADDDDKIKPDHIRPIWTDDEIYAIHTKVSVPAVATDDQKAKAFIRACIKARKDYRGSGNPVMFADEDMITNCLLMEDNDGRIVYDTEEKLRTALRVRKIVPVPVMENQTRQDATGNTLVLAAIVVNLSDYTVGADKGGAISMFEDFDIDYNQEKYLIETRISGALTKPKSAIVVEMDYQSPSNGQA